MGNSLPYSYNEESVQCYPSFSSIDRALNSLVGLTLTALQPFTDPYRLLYLRFSYDKVADTVLLCSRDPDITSESWRVLTNGQATQHETRELFYECCMLTTGTGSDSTKLTYGILSAPEDFLKGSPVTFTIAFHHGIPSFIERSNTLNKLLSFDT